MSDMDAEKEFQREAMLESAELCLEENDIDNAYKNLKEALDLGPTKEERVKIIKLCRIIGRALNKRADSLIRSGKMYEAEAEWEKVLYCMEGLGYPEEAEGLRKGFREKITEYTSGIHANGVRSGVDGLLMLNRYRTGLNGDRPTREETLNALHYSAARFYLEGDESNYRQAAEAIDSLKREAVSNHTDRE